MDEYAKELLQTAIQTLNNLTAYVAGQEASFAAARSQFNIVSFVESEEGDTMTPKYLDGNFRQKGNILEYRFRHNDVQISVSGASKAECWSKRTKIITGETKTKRKDSFTTEQWFYEWFETYKKGKTSERDQADKLRRIKNLCEVIGKISLCELDGITIQNYLNTFNEHPNAQKKVGLIIGAALKKAVTLRRIEHNPYDSCEIQRYDVEHYRALEIEEQAILFDKASEKYRGLFFFQCVTGIRIGRTLSLTVDDIDEEREEIRVFKKQQKGGKKYTFVPYLPELLDIINCPKSGVLFPDITKNSVKLYFNKLYKRLEIKNANIHSFRHTFISNLNFLKIPIKTIQEWAGHKDITTTMNTYAHLLAKGNAPTLDYLRRLAEKRA